MGSGEYGAAQAGLINLTQTAAKELEPYSITLPLDGGASMSLTTDAFMRSHLAGRSVFLKEI